MVVVVLCVTQTTYSATGSDYSTMWILVSIAAPLPLSQLSSTLTVCVAVEKR